jgi:hypothetical protein
MNDLEDRLRSGLHDLAETVPPSPHPRADLERRLARGRRWRTPVLVTAAAAAAAVVLAIVVIPGAVGGRKQTGDVTTPMLPPPTSRTAATPPEIGGSGTEKDPWVLARVTEGGIEKDAVFWLTGSTGNSGWCMRWRAVDPDDQPSLPGPECDPLPATWPTGPPGGGPGMHVLQTEVLSNYLARTGPLQNLMVFITSPTIAKLDVQHGDGSTLTSVRELGRDDDGVTFYLADFGDTAAGFGWTAWDAQGNVVENAIT